MHSITLNAWALVDGNRVENELLSVPPRFMVNTLRTWKLFVLPACMAVVTAVGVTGLAASPEAAMEVTVKKVAVFADAALSEPARYGLRKLEGALRQIHCGLGA